MRIKQPDDLVFYAQMDEGFGSRVTDLSNYNNHGIIYGATWTKGIVGNALSFDGVDDYVDIPDAPSLRFGNNSFTIAMWIKPVEVRADFIRYTAVVNTGYFYIGYDGTRILLATRSSDTNEYFTIGTGTLNWGNWNYIVFSRDAENNTWYYYLNGEEIQSEIDTRTGKEESFAGWRIGYKLWNGYFNGTIDEVRIYNRALSPEEIKQHYQDGFRKLFKAGERPFLIDRGNVLKLAFNEPSGTVVYDNSGFKNDGTIYGATRVVSPLGKALSFDGVDDYVEVPDSASLDFTDKTSFEAWIKPESYISSGLARIEGRTNDVFEVALGSSAGTAGVPEGNLAVYTPQMGWKNTGYHCDLNNWYHIVVVFDGSYWKAYINGNLVWTSGSTTIDISGNVYIASRYNGVEKFNGTIDEVRIYNRALSEAEIKALFAASVKKHVI